MKKVLAAVLVVCVVLAAGAAFAQQGNGKIREHRNQQAMNHPEIAQQQPGKFQPQPRPFAGQPGPEQCHEFGGHCGRGHRNFTPDMPPEIREKAADLAKLRIDLEEALSANPMNKAKALEVFAKMQKLENEVESWRFEKKLERIEEFRKQMELNKNVPPKPMPKEAPEK
ncbi:MAG: hypothetical protein IJU31_02835 [Synergistaceae bacterium]|nr:hypothetical protein [Synergistaceae bacterium]